MRPNVINHPIIRWLTSSRREQGPIRGSLLVSAVERLDPISQHKPCEQEVHPVEHLHPCHCGSFVHGSVEQALSGC